MRNWAFQNMTKTFIQEKLPYLRLSHIQHRITESFSTTPQERDFFFSFQIFREVQESNREQEQR